MNTLTPKQLDMIKRLQPFFKERMGEWQLFDDLVNSDGEFVAPVIEPMEINTLNDEDIGVNEGVLRIPKPIDWQNPERGLWGMIRRFKTLGEGTDCVCYISNHVEVTGKDPFTALLKALCEQEKV